MSVWSGAAVSSVSPPQGSPLPQASVADPLHNSAMSSVSGWDKPPEETEWALRFHSGELGSAGWQHSMNFFRQHPWFHGLGLSLPSASFGLYPSRGVACDQWLAAFLRFLVPTQALNKLGGTPGVAEQTPHSPENGAPDLAGPSVATDSSGGHQETAEDNGPLSTSGVVAFASAVQAAFCVSPGAAPALTTDTVDPFCPSSEAEETSISFSDPLPQKVGPRLPDTVNLVCPPSEADATSMPRSSSDPLPQQAMGGGVTSWLQQQQHWFASAQDGGAHPFTEGPLGAPMSPSSLPGVTVSLDPEFLGILSGPAGSSITDEEPAPKHSGDWATWCGGGEDTTWGQEGQGQQSDAHAGDSPVSSNEASFVDSAGGSPVSSTETLPVYSGGGSPVVSTETSPVYSCGGSPGSGSTAKDQIPLRRRLQDALKFAKLAKRLKRCVDPHSTELGPVSPEGRSVDAAQGRLLSSATRPTLPLKHGCPVPHPLPATEASLQDPAEGAPSEPRGIVKLVLQHGVTAGEYQRNGDGLAWRKNANKKKQRRMYYNCCECHRNKSGGHQRCAKKVVVPLEGFQGVFLVRYYGTHGHTTRDEAPKSEEETIWAMRIEDRKKHCASWETSICPDLVHALYQKTGFTTSETSTEINQVRDMMFGRSGMILEKRKTMAISLVHNAQQVT